MWHYEQALDEIKETLEGEYIDVARERYEDLCEYFNNNPHTIELILNDRKEFKAWLERMHWHVLECEKLARKLEALEGNGMEQERKYTFGNDGFSLENAYHDCKLVFDGITDDDSFQKADTGLILYFANEIIYALHEALKGKDTNVSSIDTISRQAAIDALGNEPELWEDPYSLSEDYSKGQREQWNNDREVLLNLPSAQPNAIPLEWIQRYADDWEDIGYAYENPILGMLEDWRREQDEQENNIS